MIRNEKKRITKTDERLANGFVAIDRHGDKHIGWVIDRDELKVGDRVTSQIAAIK